MGKIKELLIKRKQMRVAYSEMMDAKERITCYPEAYYLHSNEDENIQACCAKFKKVYSSRISQNIIDDNGCVSNCGLFNSEICKNKECSMYARNVDYFVCKEKYEAARAAYLNFIKNNIFCRKK